jgi:hypothetical protein
MMCLPPELPPLPLAMLRRRAASAVAAFSWLILPGFFRRAPVFTPRGSSATPAERQIFLLRYFCAIFLIIFAGAFIELPPLRLVISIHIASDYFRRRRCHVAIFAITFAAPPFSATPTLTLRCRQMPPSSIALAAADITCFSLFS